MSRRRVRREVGAWGGKRARTGVRQNNQRSSKACGKRRYPDKASAVASLHRIQNREANGGRRDVVPQRVYECDWCKGFHLTSRA